MASVSLPGRGESQRDLPGAGSRQRLQLAHLPLGGTLMLQEVGQACSSSLQNLVAPDKQDVTPECEIVKLCVKIIIIRR